MAHRTLNLLASKAGWMPRRSVGMRPFRPVQQSSQTGFLVAGAVAKDVTHVIAQTSIAFEAAVSPATAKAAALDVLRKLPRFELLRETDETASVRTGSRTYFRLMGMSGGRTRLPMQIDVLVESTASGAVVTLDFRSNEGPYLFKLPSVEAFYGRAFEDIARGIRASV